MSARLGALPTALVLAWSPCAFALDPALDVSQYAHTAWKVSDGFAQAGITSIAQTPDGYLWLGTEFGLLRFDGVRSVPWHPPADQPLPSNYVASLLAARDGTLWIGTANGLASWRDGHLTRYAELAGQGVHRMLEDHEGSVWLAGIGLPTGRLCAIRNRTVRCYGEDGRLGLGVMGLYEDGKGNLWAGVRDGLWRWRPDPPEFHSLPGEPNGVRNLSEDRDGALVIGMWAGFRRFINGRMEPYPLPGIVGQLRSEELLRDRDGGLWIGTADRGLVHVGPGGTDGLAQSDGLSGDYVHSLFEDREGNVWVGTADGLDRFRDVAVATLSVKQGLNGGAGLAVLAATDGSVWFAMSDGLNRWSDGRATVPRTGGAKPDGKLDGQRPHSLFQDHRGRIWVSTAAGIGYLENGRFIRRRDVPEGNVRAIAEDAGGNLWLSDQDLGLFRLPPGNEARQLAWATLGRQDFATALAADPLRGGLWIGFLQGGVAYLGDGRVRESYAAKDGLAAGRVEDLRVDRDGTLWAATEGGLSRLKGGRLATLTRKNGLPCDGVHWVMEDDARSLWMYTPCGLVRVTRAELDAWATAVDGNDRATPAIRATVLDTSDGVRLRARPGGYRPSVARSRDGRLWFLPAAGVSVLDPRRLPFNALPPPVHVEQITADRKVYDATSFANGRLRLPPLSRDLEIEYTGLSVIAPEKVRFRYKLEGRDREWQDVGTRRQAFYSSLPPGDYRFRVTASNNSGVWNEAGSFVDFSVAPAYYQTSLFRVSCLAAFLALLGVAYQLRLRQVAQRVRLRSEARLEERERIARDLHDTLLQSVQGLILKIHAVAQQIHNDEPARRALEQTLDHADQVLAEGRNRVRDLRVTAESLGDLPAAFRRVAEEMPGGRGVTFRTVMEGGARELQPLILEECYGIGREAVINALAHSGGLSVEVEITYDPRQFRLRIRDDGRGIDPGILDEGGRPGHWGLQGMRERAQRIGAQLQFWSRPATGTEVELTVPAQTAYRSFPRPRASWFRRFPSRGW